MTDTEPDGLRRQAVRIALKAYISKVVSYMDEETGIQGKDKIGRVLLPEAIENVTVFLLQLEKVSPSP